MTPLYISPSGDGPSIFDPFTLHHTTRNIQSANIADLTVASTQHASNVYILIYSMIFIQPKISTMTEHPISSRSQLLVHLRRLQCCWKRQFSVTGSQSTVNHSWETAWLMASAHLLEKIIALTIPIS